LPLRVDNGQVRAEVTIMARIAWQVAGDYFETCS
jgi:hypothetical protein